MSLLTLSFMASIGQTAIRARKTGNQKVAVYLKGTPEYTAAAAAIDANPELVIIADAQKGASLLPMNTILTEVVLQGQTTPSTKRFDEQGNGLVYDKYQLRGQMTANNQGAITWIIKPTGAEAPVGGQLMQFPSFFHKKGTYVYSFTGVDQQGNPTGERLVEALVDNYQNASQGNALELSEEMQASLITQVSNEISAKIAAITAI